MKNLLMVTVLLLSLASIAQRKIGEDHSGTFVITENISDIKTKWQAELTKQHITSTLTQWSIVSRTDGTATYYLLLAQTADGMTRMATGAVKDNLNFNLAAEEFGHTVTCTGCSFGCSPEYIKKLKSWACSAGCGQNCTKSETITTN